ncbi:phosphotransferase family protein [Nocardioides sp. GXZ039]|uniref:phosphotransferase family protein n=1 Tax=Nocardioides sp. GXZ039 TaxID=3136018 RepID=UPI0030F3FD0C
MLSRRHVAALVDLAGDRVRIAPVDVDWPSHRDLVAAAGDPGAVLVAPPLREDDGTVVDVLRWSGVETAGDRWQRLDDEVDLPAPARRTLLDRVAELRGSAPDDGRQQWFMPGWFDGVRAWVDRELAARGDVRLDDGEIGQMWSLSVVVRFGVRSPDGADGVVRDVWFKATCTGFAAEPVLTAWVAGLAASRVPTILALDADRAWMLLEAFSEDAEPSADSVGTLAAELARLQLASRHRIDALLAAGAPERGEEATVVGLRELIRSGVERDTMTEAQRVAAADAEPWMAAKVAELHGLGLPLTLVHGDLHLGNATHHSDGPVIFDWTDACVAHPYLDARHLARSVAQQLDADAAETVREAYLEPWREAYPAVDHDRAWELTDTAERVFTLLSYEDIYRAQPEWARWELATVTVDLLDKLVDQRERELTPR